jgi:hypothetical protein
MSHLNNLGPLLRLTTILTETKTINTPSLNLFPLRLFRRTKHSHLTCHSLRLAKHHFHLLSPLQPSEILKTRIIFACHVERSETPD